MARYSKAAIVCAMTACLSGATSVAAQAPPFHIVPRRSVFYQKQPCGPQPQDVLACAKQPGVKACKVVRPVNATGVLRIAARVAIDAQSGWSVRVRDALLGTTLEQRSVASAGLFWTDEVASHGAFLELMHASAQTQGDIEIERVDCEATIAHQEAIVGVNGLTLLVSLEAPQQWIKDLGRSVARLRFMTDLGEATCTGFLISPSVLMTNQHCIKTKEDVESLVAEFGYDTLGARMDRYHGAALVDVSGPKDYALVRLEGTPGASWGVLTVADTPPDATHALVIIQHPRGDPKKISLEHCNITAVDRPGADGTTLTDFSHECDTLSGSSGSPVIDVVSKKVVGLHHFGYVFEDKPPINQAVIGAQIPH